jgi:hypothetical protein
MNDHFVIVGAQRSGTTGLYRTLQQHPDICLAEPLRPEPKFFLDSQGVRGGYQEYLRRHFAHHAGQRLLGEKSTSYIERDEAIAEIHKLLPQAKLVFVLRNPVMRAYSNWRFSRDHGLETLSFEDALDAEPARLAAGCPDGLSVNPFAYATRGRYTDYLSRWVQAFPREQILLVLSETLFEGDQSVRGLLDRLGVASDVPLSPMGPVNASTGGPGLPPAATAKRLQEAFAPGMEELARDWGVDISPWLR